MRNIAKYGMISAVGLLLTLIGCGNNANPDATLGQNAGNSLDQLAQGIGRSLKNVKQTLDQTELSGKVYSRLIWDKRIRPLGLTVDAGPSGLIAISGKVPNEELHQRALDLIAETVGVKEVVDKLVVSNEPSMPRDSNTNSANRDDFVVPR